MKKLNNLMSVKAYLDHLSKKPISDFDSEEYLPLEEFFFDKKNEYSAIESDCRAFIFNDYMDGKISFEQMLCEIKKHGGNY